MRADEINLLGGCALQDEQGRVAEIGSIIEDPRRQMRKEEHHAICTPVDAWHQNWPGWREVMVAQLKAEMKRDEMNFLLRKSVKAPKEKSRK